MPRRPSSASGPWESPSRYASAFTSNSDDTGTLTLTAKVRGAGTLKAEAFWDGNKVGEAAAETAGDAVTLSLRVSEVHLWELGKGGLYDLELSFGEDRVKSYFGMREVGLANGKFLLNGKVVFQRLVLDQGFYPDGVYTAPSDGELLADVERSMALGFNGARLHEKIFEERFLYHADRMGYMVWGEYPNWGLDESRADAICGMLPEWLAEIERDFNHPAIVGIRSPTKTTSGWSITPPKRWIPPVRSSIPAAASTWRPISTTCTITSRTWRSSAPPTPASFRTA